MRTFGSTFTTEKTKVPGDNESTPAPFMTVVFRFADGDLRISERGRPVTVDGDDVEAIVTSFGDISSTLDRDPGIVDVVDTTINFVNLAGSLSTGGRLSGFFSSDFEAIDVDFYLHFTDALGTTVLATEIFASGVARFACEADEEEGSLKITNIKEKYFARNVLRTVTKTEYPNAENDGVINLPFGDAIAVPSFRIDKMADRFTVGESPPENPVTAIGQLYWDGRPFSEADIVLRDADGDSYDFQVGGLDGNFGNYPLTVGVSASATPNLSELSGVARIRQKFVAPRNIRNSSMTFYLNGDPGYNARVAVYDVTAPPEISLIGERTVILTETGWPFQSIALDQPLIAGHLYEAVFAFPSEAPAATLQFSSWPNDPDNGQYYATWETNSENMGDVVDTVSGAFAVSMQLDGYNADGVPHVGPLVDGDIIKSPIYATKYEQPGAVLAGFTVRLFVPEDSIEFKGSITSEVTSELNGQVSTLASASVSADDVLAAIAELGGSYGYLAYTALLDAPVFLPAGPYEVSVTGQFDSVERVLSGWQMRGGLLTRTGQNFSTPYRTSLASTFTPIASIPLIGNDGTEDVPVSIDIDLVVMKFDRFPNTPVRITEDELGDFDVAAVKAQALPRRFSETARLAVPDGVTISADLTSTYSDATDIFDALRKRAGVPDARKDTAHFSALGRFDGAVTQQQTYTTLLSRLAFECAAEVDWQWDKMTLRPYPREVGETVKTFTRATIQLKAPDSLVMDLKTTRSPRTEVINHIDARWRRRLSGNTGRAQSVLPVPLLLRDSDFDAAEVFKSPASIAVHGPLSSPGRFDFLYVRDDNTARDSCEVWLRYWYVTKRLVTWSGFLESVGVEKLDQIDFDTSTEGFGFGEGGFGEGGFGGGTAFNGLAPGSLHLVQKVGYDWARRKTLFQARELA